MFAWRVPLAKAEDAFFEVVSDAYQFRLNDAFIYLPRMYSLLSSNLLSAQK